MGVKMRNTIANGGMTGKDKGISRVFAFRNGNSYSSVKTFTKPANPRSALQTIVRSAFTASAIGWSALTQEQRDAWENEAPNWLNTGIFGIKRMSGQNLYIGTNIALAVAGLPAINVPGQKELLGSILNVTLAYAGGALNLELLMDDSSPSNAVQVAISSPMSMGSSKVSKLTVLKSYPCENAVAENLTADYVAKYGAIPAGQKIFAEVRFVSEGGNVINLKQFILLT